MFQASTAHNQEVMCIYMADGTSKMTGILEVPFATKIHLTS
jgi:hypothetical protein